MRTLDAAKAEFLSFKRSRKHKSEAVAFCGGLLRELLKVEISYSASSDYWEFLATLEEEIGRYGRAEKFLLRAIESGLIKDGRVSKRLAQLRVKLGDVFPIPEHLIGVFSDYIEKHLGVADADDSFGITKTWLFEHDLGDCEVVLYWFKAKGAKDDIDILVACRSRMKRRGA